MTSSKTNLMEFYQIMLKNTLFVVASTIAVVTSASLPASATPTCIAGLPGCGPEPVRVPEPTTVLGLLSVGAGMAAKKMVDSHKASK